MRMPTLAILIFATLFSSVLAAEGKWKRKFSIPRITSHPSLTLAPPSVTPSYSVPTYATSKNMASSYLSQFNSAVSSVTKGADDPAETETSSMTTIMTTMTTKMGNGTVTLTSPVSTAPVSTGGAAMGMGMLGAGPLVGAGVAALAFL